MHLEHRPSDEMDLMIEAVNAADLGWKADTCKYQRTHANYGDHCDTDKVSLAQTSAQGFFDDFNMEDLTTALQGLDQDDKNNFGQKGDKKFTETLDKAQKFQKKYGDANEIPDDDLPDTLDWRDYNGYDFTSYFRD